MSLVSIIIPTHNRAKMLNRAVDSVLAQTQTDFELIIVSDASTDGTEYMVKSYDDPRVISLRHDQPKGASSARNTGLKACKGQYIAFLDDDDEWLPNKLQAQLSVIDNSPPEVGLVYTWMEYVQDGKSIETRAPKLKGYIFPEMLDKQAITNSSTLLIKREVLNKVKGFDEDLPRGNDGDFIRRITKHYHVDFVPEILAKIHVGHEDRISINSEKNMRNVIHALKKRLVDFESDFEKYTDQKANVLYNIGAHYFKIGEYIEAINYFKKSILCKKDLKQKFIILMRTGRLIISCLLKRRHYATS